MSSKRVSANPSISDGDADSEDEDGGGGLADIQMDVGGASEALPMDVRPDGEALVKPTRVFAADGLSFAEVVKKRKEFVDEDDLGWEKRAHPLQRMHKDEVNPFQDCLVSLCKSRGTMQGHGGRVIDAETESLSLATWLGEAMRMGICIFFMAKSVHGLQVRAWVRSLSDGVDPQQVIFLGRSSFYVRCRDYKQKFSLLSKSGAWAGNLFGIPLPWEESFDPCVEFASKCPVWVTLKHVPVFLLPHLEKILACMGKILYIPKLGCYVPSRTIRICVLWQLDKEIPDYLKIPVGKEDALFIQLAFEAFPLACFKCNQFGHYAKMCPQNQKVLKDASAPLKIMEVGHINLEQQQQDGNKSVATEFRKDSSSIRDTPKLKLTLLGREGTCKGGSESSNPFSGLDVEHSACKKLSRNDDNVAKDGKAPSKKSKKKKVKRKKKTEAKDKEAINLEATKLYVELNSDVENGKGEIVGNGSKEEPQERMENNNEENSREQQQPMEENMSLEEERSEKKDVLAETKVICFKKYLNEESQKYHILVSTFKEQDCWYIEFGEKRWKEMDFFRLHNLNPGEVILVTENGRFGYRES